MKKGKFYKILDYFSMHAGQSRLTTVEVDSFLSFYRQQAEDIMRHREFENDLKANVKNSESILLEYRTEDYIKNIHHYFVEKGFYSHITEREFENMVIQILAPDTATRDLIQRNVRKEIFNGTLLLISQQGKIDIKNLVRFYYKHITSLKDGINGLDRDELTQLFRESIEGLDIQKTLEVEDRGTATITQIKSFSLISDMLLTFGIRRRRDLERYFTRSVHLRYFSALIVWSGCWIFCWMAPVLSFLNPILTYIDALQYSFLRISLLIVFGMLVISTLFEYVVTLDRRKRIRRILHLLVATLNIRPDEIKGYFKDTFLFNYEDI